MTTPSYVLMTAAHNEARFLPDTIASVLAQERPPRALDHRQRRVDRRDRPDRVRGGRSARLHPVPAVREHGEVPLRHGRHLLEEGLRRCAPACGASERSRARYLGNLDADVTFEPDLFARLLARMQAAPDIGLGGGSSTIRATGSANALFHQSRSGGRAAPVLPPRRSRTRSAAIFPLGQEDTIAQIMVRMHGYRVRAFEELRVLHQQDGEDKGRNPLKGQFHAGKMERAMGYHPLHMTARCAASAPAARSKARRGSRLHLGGRPGHSRRGAGRGRGVQPPAAAGEPPAAAARVARVAARRGPRGRLFHRLQSDRVLSLVAEVDIEQLAHPLNAPTAGPRDPQAGLDPADLDGAAGQTEPLDELRPAGAPEHPAPPDAASFGAIVVAVTARLSGLAARRAAGGRRRAVPIVAAEYPNDPVGARLVTGSVIFDK